jgi:hypothetical protein
VRDVKCANKNGRCCANVGGRGVCVDAQEGICLDNYFVGRDVCTNVRCAKKNGRCCKAVNGRGVCMDCTEQNRRNPLSNNNRRGFCIPLSVHHLWKAA